MKQSTFHFAKEAAFMFPNTKGSGLFWDLANVYDKKYLNEKNPFAKKALKKIDDTVGKTYDGVRGSLAAAGTIAGGVIGGHIINQNVGYYANKAKKSYNMKFPEVKFNPNNVLRDLAYEAKERLIKSLTERYKLSEDVVKQFRELLATPRTYISKIGDNICVMVKINGVRKVIGGFNIKNNLMLIKDDIENINKEMAKKLIEL